ncbi:MAG: 16S rRNA (guanine(527)-N(7))-methyltransferase RsmG [Termitinemataceae bacterium]|nr:MAG: 16S rRNA (guanine(527)-N(7))-methyltransferase RsmG [Termitinemataceae bacterium]
MNDLLKEGLYQIINKSPLALNLLKERLDDVIRLLNVYICEIEMFNPRYGLVKYETRDELITKHILDSLAGIDSILKILNATHTNAEIPFQFADVGSGAGLPGIPLAIAMNTYNWTLIERAGKRADFLQNSSLMLGLKNVEVLQTDFTKVQKKFDLITFRAVSALDGLFVKNIFKLLKQGGCIAAYKGRIERIEDEIANLDYEKSLNVNIERIDVPFLDESRHIVMISA